MKTAAVLTYPGHMLMTVLCLRSIQQHYTDIEKIYVLYDDIADAWLDYPRDILNLYIPCHKHVELMPYSYLPNIDRCWVGWWRAQLIKLHVDLVLPGDEWFVVDGDVIFDETCDVRNITPYSPWIDQRDNVLDQMVGRYVDHMLGTVNARVSIPEYPLIITSIIPFRWLDREQLSSLRAHVCKTTAQTDMLHYHCDLFVSQDIVGYVPEGDRMVMHEWELIEAWNHLHRPDQYQLVMTGSGYQVTMDTTGFQHPRFRHNSMLDRDLGREWFERQGITTTDELWNKIAHA